MPSSKSCGKELLYLIYSSMLENGLVSVAASISVVWMKPLLVR